MKREIKNSLVRLLNGNKKMEERINKMDNVLDEVYRYVKDCETQRLPVDLLVKRWIKDV